MSVNILYSGPKITEAQLGDFEQQRQITLPADYRKFLLRTNGGVPVPNVFRVKWGEYDAYAHVGRFLGLDYPAALYSFEWNTRVQERISPKFFILSKDYSTFFHLVCIVISGHELGKVYYLPQYDGKEDLSDEEYSQYETDYPTSYFVADSFTRFLEQLIEPPSGLFET